jgi:hypothetical protein
MDYYNGKRVEQGRADIAGAEAAGRILCRPILVDCITYMFGLICGRHKYPFCPIDNVVAAIDV